MLRPKAPVSPCDSSWGDLGRAELSAGILCFVLRLSQPTEALSLTLCLCAQWCLTVVFGDSHNFCPGAWVGDTSFLGHVPSSHIPWPHGSLCEASAPVLVRSPCEGLRRVTQFAGTSSTVVAAPSPAGADISPSSPHGLWRGMQPAALGSGAEQIAQLFPLLTVMLPLEAACCLLTAVPLSVLHRTQNGGAGAPFPTHLQPPSFSPAPLHHPEKPPEAEQPRVTRSGMQQLWQWALPRSYGNVTTMSPATPAPSVLAGCWALGSSAETQLIRSFQ